MSSHGATQHCSTHITKVSVNTMSPVYHLH